MHQRVVPECRAVLLFIGVLPVRLWLNIDYAKLRHWWVFGLAPVRLMCKHLLELWLES